MSDSSLSNQDPMSRKTEAPPHPFMGNDPSPVAKYYFSPPGHKMIRPDGVAVHFINKVHKSEVLPTQKFLDKEIKNGHLHLRYATEQEVEAYDMHVDPRGTLARQIRPQVEQEMKENLERQLRNEMRRKASSEGMNLTEDQIAALFGDDSDDVGHLLTGVDSSKSGELIESGSAKIQIMREQNQARLGGITGTDKLAGAKDSNSQNL